MTKKTPVAKEAICKAFLKLLKQKDYEDIMVCEIIKGAFINKSTFYKYFSCKHNLLEYIETQLLEGFRPLLSSALYFNPFLEINPLFIAYFSYIQQNYELYSLLLNRTNHEFESMQQQFFYDYTYNTTKIREFTIGSDPAIRQEFWPVIISSFYSGLFTYWVKEQMPFSAKEMGSIINTWWTRFCPPETPILPK